MDFIALGQRYGSDRTHDEVAYCVPLLKMHLARLKKQGIEPEIVKTLDELDGGLTSRDEQLSEAQKALEKSANELEALLDETTTLVGQAWSFARKAFEEKAPAMLDDFPARSDAGKTIERSVQILNEASGFVKTHQAALAAAETPPELAGQLTGLAQKILETNRRKEEAARMVEALTLEICETRGRIFHHCRRAYDAGRVEFLKERAIRSQFRFESMRRQASSPPRGPKGGNGKPGEGAGSGKGTGQAGGKGSRRGGKPPGPDSTGGTGGTGGTGETTPPSGSGGTPGSQGGSSGPAGGQGGG